MPRRSCARNIFRSAVLALCLTAGPLWADTAETCTELDPGKDGSCGKAIAAFRAGAETPPPLMAAVLPDDPTDVVHCFLDIEVNPITQIVSGSNSMTITVRAASITQFTLDLRSNMSVSSVLVDGQAATWTRPSNQVRVNLPRAYNLGETFQVKVTYSGTPSNLNWGSFSFSRHNNNWIAASLSQPWYANTWWPCKERIDDKFTIDTWVTVPAWMTVAGNGRLLGTDDLSGSRKRFRWSESYPISVYLVSVAMTNYVKWTDYYHHPGGAMPVEFYIYPEQEASVRPQVAHMVATIEAFSRPDIFGQYPFINEKYGLAQFAWCCGMEHQTITSQGSFPETRNVHELAHQWWGDAVTCKTWNDIWLNEGFARWSEALWMQLKPGGSYQAYINQLRGSRPSAVSGTVYRYDASTVSSIFSTTYSYNKGGWVVHMLRYVLGDEAFFGSMAAYRAQFEGGAADTEDLKNSIEAHTGQDMDWFFDEWVYNGGAPSYRYGWQPVQIAGQHWVRLYVQQYQHTLSPPFPLFRMPIEITVNSGGGPQRHRITNWAESQWYLLPAAGPVSGVEFDEDEKILRNDAAPVSYAAGPPKLVAATPGPGAVLSAGVSSVTLQFSGPITVTATDFTVTGSRDGVRPFTVIYDPAEFRVTLQFTVPLGRGQSWTVRVGDTIRSLPGGAALDGELPSLTAPDGLPSGDGLPGGAALFSFNIPMTTDFDGDGDVDQTDFGRLQACINGPNLLQLEPSCASAMLDGDGDVDANDVLIFLNCMAGPNVSPPDGCLP